MRNLLYLALAITITACSSGNSDDNVTALSLPKSIDALSAQQLNSNSQTGMRRLSNTFLPTAYNDPDTDFSNDGTISLVYDNDLIYVKSINYLLCFIDKFGYQSMVNSGPYIASVNWAKCYEEIFPDYAEFIAEFDPVVNTTIISSRSSNSSPHRIQIWMPDFVSNNDTTQTQAGLVEKQSVVEILINAAPSETNPFGDFVIKFVSIEDASLHGGTLGQEFITSRGNEKAYLTAQGDTIFKSVNIPTDVATVTNENYDAVSIRLDGGNSQSGSIRSDYKDHDSTYAYSTAVNYNATRVLKGQFDPNTLSLTDEYCMARDETQGNLFSYNLYHRDDGDFRSQPVTGGQKVDIVNFFSFYYNGNYGWMRDGYYWLESGALPDNATISKQSYGSFNEETLTVKVSPGRLHHQYQQELALSTLQDRDLVYYGVHPDATVSTYKNWVIRITANNEFEFVKERRLDNAQYTESDTFDHDNNVDTPEIAVLAPMVFLEGRSISFHTKTYDGYNYTYNSATAAGNRTVTSDITDAVTPSYAQLFPTGVNEVELYCYKFCPKGGLTQEQVNSASSYTALYHNTVFSATPRTYTAKREDYKVYLMDNSTTPATSVQLTNLDLSKFSMTNLSSGRLMAQPLPAPATEFLLNAAIDRYSFTASNEGYYQTVVLLDDTGTEFKFDEPIGINYQYDAAHDMYNTNPTTNPNHGKNMELTYYANGALSGLPYVRNENGYAFMEINLKPGTELSTTENSQTNHFVVKARWEFQYMASKDPSECSNLNVADLVSDPDMAYIAAEEVQPVPFTAADKPVVEGPPAIAPDAD